MWAIWSDIGAELRLREPHNPVTVLHDNPDCAPLFGPWPMLQMPANLPPQIVQQIHQQVLQQIQVIQVPPARFETIHVIMESSRYASRFVIRGMVFGTRGADQQIKLSTVNERQGWITMQVGVSPDSASNAKPSEKSKRGATKNSRSRTKS